MATVSFRLRSKANKSVAIKVYLSSGRGKFIEKSTPFSIHPKEWSVKTGFPKQTVTENKMLIDNLEVLQKFIERKLNDDEGKGLMIDDVWLQNSIDACFNRAQKVDVRLVVNHIQHIIDNAHKRKVQGQKKLGLSKSRVEGYKTFKKNFESFQDFEKKPIYFSDINQNLISRFTGWLLDTKHFAVSYAGKHIDNLKTVCLDAEKREIATNPFFKHIESFTENNEDRYIITLTENDLEKLRSIQIDRKALENARNWILLGCEIGQRGGDLTSLTEQSVRQLDEFLVVDVIQQKTGKLVTAAITDPFVIEMVTNNFPRQISTQKLNEYIKDVCQLAGIEELIEGKKMNKETKRKEFGKYPKHELIASHCFRRSFSTNNYYSGLPVQFIKEVTGHSREGDLLTYVNARADKDAMAKLVATHRLNMKKQA